MNFLKRSFLLCTFLLLSLQETWAMDSGEEKGKGIHTGKITVLHVIDDKVAYRKGNFKICKDENKKHLYTEPNKPAKPPTQSSLIYKGQPKQLPEEETALKRVIPGKDGREQITTTTEWPHCIHAQLTMHRSDGEYGGSGILIGPHHLLTAGHNVYSYRKGEWAKTISVYLGLNKTVAPFGEIKVVKAYTFKEWVQDGNKNHDMALLILSQPIGYETGWAGLLSLNDADLLKEEVTITGYPGDHEFNKMMTMSDRIKSLESGQFYYDIDTAAGQSGSGVWINKWGSPYVLGVHAYGEGAQYTGNSGVRLAAEKFDKVVKWISKSFVPFTVPPQITDIDRLLTGQYLIKNVKHSEFIFVADKDRINGSRVVEATPSIASKSIFSFQKNEKGEYLIKNVKHNEYIFVTDKDRINGSRVVEAMPGIETKSYFNILNKEKGYLIKNVKHSEYIFVTDKDRINGDRVVEAMSGIETKSYFNFIPYDVKLF